MRRSDRTLISSVSAPGGLESRQKQGSPSPPHDPIPFIGEREILPFELWTKNAVTSSSGRNQGRAECPCYTPPFSRRNLMLTRG